MKEDTVCKVYDKKEITNEEIFRQEIRKQVSEYHKVLTTVSEKMQEMIGDFWAFAEKATLNHHYTDKEKQKLYQEGVKACSNMMSMQQSMSSVINLSYGTTKVNITKSNVCYLMDSMNMILEEKTKVEGGLSANTSLTYMKCNCGCLNRDCFVYLDEELFMTFFSGILSSLSKINDIGDITYGYQMVKRDGGKGCHCYFTVCGLKGINANRIGRAFSVNIFEDEEIDINRTITRIGLAALRETILLSDGTIDVRLDETNKTIIDIFIPCQNSK